MIQAKAQGSLKIQLVEQTTKNPDKFLALYDCYFPRVYTYFRYRFHDPALCDDLCAQTFLQALEHIDQYIPERGPLVGWLFGIARNLANKHLKRNRRFPQLSLDTLPFIPCNKASPEEQAVENDEQRKILQVMACLPPQQRDLLGLKFSAELNNRQIAALTGLSEQNVAVTIFRAIRKLRMAMGEREDQNA